MRATRSAPWRRLSSRAGAIAWNSSRTRSPSYAKTSAQWREQKNSYLRALNRLGVQPGSPDLWLVKGAAELLLRKEEGFESLYNGVCDYTADPFSLAFARYAINHSPFPQKKKSKELNKLELTFSEASE